MTAQTASAWSSSHVITSSVSRTSASNAPRSSDAAAVETDGERLDDGAAPTEPDGDTGGLSSSSSSHIIASSPRPPPAPSPLLCASLSQSASSPLSLAPSRTRSAIERSAAARASGVSGRQHLAASNARTASASARNSVSDSSASAVGIAVSAGAEPSPPRLSASHCWSYGPRRGRRRTSSCRARHSRPASAAHIAVRAAGRRKPPSA